MSLQTILFGEFTPPPVARSRYVSLSGFKSSTGKNISVHDRHTEKPGYALVRKALKKHGKLTTAELAPIIGKSLSYTHTILRQLKERGELDCAPGRKPPTGGNISTCYYLVR